MACEILNGKERDVVENTSLKKIKDIIEKKFGYENIKNQNSSQEHIQIITCLLHWLLVYSFTCDDLTNTGLFATILADNQIYGTNFLSIVQMKSNYLLKYMITSFLLSRG